MKRLKTDYLDTYLLHRPDTLMEADDVAEAFDYLHRSGKVRYFGVSNFKPIQIELLEKYINQRIIINQVQVSIAHTDIIDDQVTMNLQDPFMPETTGDLLDYCRLKDITIQAWSSLQYGFYGGVFMGEEGRQLYPNLNRVVDRMAQEKNSTPTQIGLAWLMRHPANIMPLIGTTNKDRMADSCKACDVELSRAEWYELYRMTLLDEGKAVLTNSNTKEEQKKHKANNISLPKALCNRGPFCFAFTAWLLERF